MLSHVPPCIVEYSNEFTNSGSMILHCCASVYCVQCNGKLYVVQQDQYTPSLSVSRITGLKKKISLSLHSNTSDYYNTYNLMIFCWQ